MPIYLSVYVGVQIIFESINLVTYVCVVLLDVIQTGPNYHSKVNVRNRETFTMPTLDTQLSH